MAIDQKVVKESAESTPAPPPAIENELPAYRAISAQAIFSLIFGVLSILSIATPWFLLAAAISVLLGILADRKIQRHPDMLTGRGFAQAGATLGLIFGLGSFTYTTVLDYFRTQSATRYAKAYVEKLKTEPVENLVWYKFPLEVRKEKTPQQVMAELTKAVKDPNMLTVHTGSFENMKRRLKASDNEELRFSKIETTTAQGLDVYAAALLEVNGSGNKAYPEKKQFALLVLKGRPERGKIEWNVDKFEFPYAPATYKPEPKQAPDDGHGHHH